MKKEALKPENARVKDKMLAYCKNMEGVLAVMGGLTGAAKEAKGIAARLWTAHGELTKKPSDKTAIDNFSACLKEASVNSGKLRTSATAIQQKFPAGFAGKGPNMKAFVLHHKLLLQHIETGLPKFAPARPVQGPPAPPRPAQGPPVPGKQ